MNPYLPPRLSQRAYDGIWGFIVGDALGVPHEFMPRESMDVTEMTGNGTHGQPAGTWSDDTSMLLCVLENIHARGDRVTLSRLFLKWYEEGYLTPHGEVFDIGITTRMALERLKNGVSPSRSGLHDEKSAGNGSLMRSLPYAFDEDFHRGGYRMVLESSITHRVPLCHECCYYYIRMARALAEGSGKQEALQRAGDYLRMGWRITEGTENDYEHQSLFKGLFDPAFPSRPKESIASGGYVIETLEASVWSFMNGTDYRSCVLHAVNLGGDTDTIAALTGGLAGLYYGVADIPKKWRDAIVAKEGLEENIAAWLGINTTSARE